MGISLRFKVSVVIEKGAGSGKTTSTFKNFQGFGDWSAECSTTGSGQGSWNTTSCRMTTVTLHGTAPCRMTRVTLHSTTPCRMTEVTLHSATPCRMTGVNLHSTPPCRMTGVILSGARHRNILEGPSAHPFKTSKPNNVHYFGPLGCMSLYRGISPIRKRPPPRTPL